MGKGRVLGIAAFAMAGVGVVAGAALVASSVSSCAATPTNIPVRSFQQAKNVDYLCIAYNESPGGPALAPWMNVGRPASLCTQVPLGATGSALTNHLLALVTQGARGEVAVVDLTAGGIVDESHERPGTNFIPVGAVPTGIVVAPDAQMTFVASADTNKPAIYGIPTNGHQVPIPGDDEGPRTIAGVLGDSTDPSPKVAPLQITDLPVCALAQPPASISVVPLSPQQGGPPAGYVIAAVLRGDGTSAARVVTIDPTGMLRGVGLAAADGGAPADGTEGGAATDAGSGAVAVTPGVLAACPILGSRNLQKPASGATWTAGPAWPDGVPYADAGDLASQEPGSGPACTATEGGAALPVAVDPNAQPYPAHAVMRDDLPLLYVGDAALPLIHVFDLGDPAHPVEREPLLATSVTQAIPSEAGALALAAAPAIGVGDMAISPVTRDYKRYLYAVDMHDGSVMVFDVTDPATSPRTPLERPHSELNPLAPRDRLSFSSPAAAVGFATHDWPIIPPGPGSTTNSDDIHAVTGLLCNPNPNASIDGGVSGVLDDGFFYTATQTTVPYAAGSVQAIPLRLRGVFGFVTLTTGQVVTIDVDDWDAPCRRPDPMTPADGKHFNYGMTGLLDLPEPDAGPPGSPTFLDPYSAPFPEPAAQVSSVTQESYFPVSAPHRMRSSQLLRNDPTSGDNAPNLVALPALSDVSGSEIVSGTGGVAPLILPTSLAPGFIDPTLVTDPTDPIGIQTAAPDASIEPSSNTVPGIRLSFDDPTASQNQAWTVTYEGVVPTLNSIAADILAPGTDGGTAGAAYESLTFSIGQDTTGAGTSNGFPAPGAGPGFCERGIEDWEIGQQRAQQALDAMNAAGLPPPPNLKSWTSDYVEILDDPVPQGDAYWSVANPCWEGLADGKVSLAQPTSSSELQSVADARYTACNQAFGTGSPDTHLARDLPILRAYEDHLDVGRFFWPPGATEQTSNRVIVGQDPTNKTALQFVSCCFHNQATFKVRAGGEWVAAGQNGVGFLNHVVASSSSETDPLAGRQGLRCVLSCDPHDVLLNSRSFDIPWSPIPWGTSGGSSHDAGSEEADARAKGGADAGADAGGGSLTCSPVPHLPSILRTSPLAFQNPYFSYVTWMGCALPSSSADHTITPRDDAWRFQVGGGFSPLTISLTGNTVVDISPQSMRYIQPLGWMAVVDGQSQGLELIDLNAVSVVHAYY